MLKNPDIEKLLSYNQINEYIIEHLHFQTYSISVPFNTAFENEIGIINKGSSVNAILGLNNEQLSYVHELNGVINYRKEELEKNMINSILRTIYLLPANILHTDI